MFYNRMFGKVDLDDPTIWKEFGRQTGCLSECFKVMLIRFHNKFAWLLSSEHIGRFQPRLKTNAEAIRAKVESNLNDDDEFNLEYYGLCSHYLDGCMVKTARPSGAYIIQQSQYSGHDRGHGIHYLVLTSPDGLANWCDESVGTGRNGDLCTLRDTELIKLLREDLFGPGGLNDRTFLFLSFSLSVSLVCLLSLSPSFHLFLSFSLASISFVLFFCVLISSLFELFNRHCP